MFSQRLAFFLAPFVASSAAYAESGGSTAHFGPIQTKAFIVFLVIAVIIAVTFAIILASTKKDTVPKIDKTKAYGIRKIFFFSFGSIVVALFAWTITITPYPKEDVTPDQVVYVGAFQFQFPFTAEPLTSLADLGTVKMISPLEVKAGELIEFRVTALDVTHDFAIYTPEGSVFAQTQAMPDYVNRLQVRFPKPGIYNVFCLEYCGGGHHNMRTMIEVK